MKQLVDSYDTPIEAGDCIVYGVKGSTTIHMYKALVSAITPNGSIKAVVEGSDQDWHIKSGYRKKYRGVTLTATHNIIVVAKWVQDGV